jgi:hypothetical protein
MSLLIEAWFITLEGHTDLILLETSIFGWYLSGQAIAGAHGLDTDVDGLATDDAILELLEARLISADSHSEKIGEIFDVQSAARREHCDDDDSETPHDLLLS